MKKLTSSSEELPASLSQFLDFDEGSKTREEILHLYSLQSSRNTGRSGSSGKTSPVSCQVQADGILVPSSGVWKNSGMGSPTEFWTQNISESHNSADVSSLWDVLETGTDPDKYYLSPRMCRGILNRAEARKKVLPDQLKRVLERQSREE